MDDLTEYERSLANRFRSALFDLEDDQADMPSMIDPEHPEYLAFLAIGFPPRRRRKSKAKRPAELTQERFEP